MKICREYSRQRLKEVCSSKRYFLEELISFRISNRHREQKVNYNSYIYYILITTVEPH